MFRNILSIHTCSTNVNMPLGMVTHAVGKKANRCVVTQDQCVTGFKDLTKGVLTKTFYSRIQYVIKQSGQYVIDYG